MLQCSCSMFYWFLFCWYWCCCCSCCHLFYDTDVPVLLFCTLVSREWRLGQEQERVERQTRPRESGALYCLVLFYHGSLYCLVPVLYLVTGLVLLHCIVFGHGLCLCIWTRHGHSGSQSGFGFIHSGFGFSGLSKSTPFWLYKSSVLDRFGFYRVRVGVSKSSKKRYNPLYFRVRVSIGSSV